MNDEYPNPNGVLIKHSQRHLNIGSILNSTFPVPWLGLVNEEGSPIKLLLNWVWDTERRMFDSSFTEEHYLFKVQETCQGAIEVDQEVKARSLGVGMVHPALPSFPLSQILTNLMQFCKKTESSNLSESVLYITCGMMELPPPLETQHLLIEGDIHDRRVYTCFRLLKWIFPDPFKDNKHYVTPELMKFGYRTEKEIWMRSTSLNEYNETINHVRTELRRYRVDENEMLDLRFPGVIVQPNVNFAAEEEEEEEEEGEEEVEEGEDGEEGEAEEEEEEEEDDADEQRMRALVDILYHNQNYYF
uniref:NAD_binding_1 domain-containing protein n=1 Tax=Caenorhabditis tropicalis TaxID=1561998 RepID=A0A1I7V304_9PELO